MYAWRAVVHYSPNQNPESMLTSQRDLHSAKLKQSCKTQHSVILKIPVTEKEETVCHVIKAVLVLFVFRQSYCLVVRHNNRILTKIRIDSLGLNDLDLFLSPTPRNHFQEILARQVLSG